MNYTKQNGFTLIELVIVIIILGILSAVAVPKFIDIQTDARISSLNGVKASLEGGSTLIYSKAAIDGLEKEGSGTKLDLGGGNEVDITYGYPDASETGIIEAVELSTGDWAWGDIDSVFSIYPSNESGTAPTDCHVTYEVNTDITKRPIITVLSDGC